jgi:hypothetical protein
MELRVNTSISYGFRRSMASKILLLISIMLLSGVANAETTLTITHPEVPAPTLIDQGAPGESVGDVRLWHVEAQVDDGSKVWVDWIMTTTGVDAPTEGVDSRISTGTFSLSADPVSQIILQGVARYPRDDATLKFSSPAVRVISGGSGRFAGARGWVESIHHEDGSWKHVFHVQ